jgi:hypothetical protein
MVISVCAKRLTAGEVQAYLAGSEPGQEAQATSFPEASHIQPSPSAASRSVVPRAQRVSVARLAA